MSLAEVFLRLGSSLTGWLVVYAHCLWLAVLPQAACGGANGNPWLATFWLALPALGLSAAIPIGRRTPGVSHILRWFALPLLVLLPLAARAVLPALQRATFGGLPLCAGDAGAALAGWEPYWAPAQLVVLCTIAGAACMGWRSLASAD